MIDVERYMSMSSEQFESLSHEAKYEFLKSIGIDIDKIKENEKTISNLSYEFAMGFGKLYAEYVQRLVDNINKLSSGHFFDKKELVIQSINRNWESNIDILYKLKEEAINSLQEVRIEDIHFNKREANEN